ncbi:hypothetical protein [Amycolatopsis orientalis]|uniref:hypothetical protein n=1 Tax=Amycolatopsis orientalis TaxID=31958 RepID=UPI0004218499|nr:hypothetical protein [Amycolatopsis orientalis]
MKKLWGILVLSLVAACVPGTLPPGPPESALGFTVQPGAAGTFVPPDPVGEAQRLFRPGPDRRAVALARAGRTLIGVGVREFPGEDRSEPIAWVSAAEGRDAREIVLPQDRPGQWATTAIAAEGDQVLVAGSLGGDVRVWASDDAGTTWTVSPVQVRGSELWFSTVLRTEGEWLLAGGSVDDALIVTGVPGAWVTAFAGEGRILGGTVDKAGKAVLFGDRTETNEHGTANRDCSVVWVAGTGWRRGELGCPAERITAAVTLEDGRVVLASSRDLWTRPS